MARTSVFKYFFGIINAYEHKNLYEAMVNAETRADNRIPMVFHKAKSGEWLVTMRAQMWVKIGLGNDCDKNMLTHYVSRETYNLEREMNNVRSSASPKMGRLMHKYPLYSRLCTMYLRDWKVLASQWIDSTSDESKRIKEKILKKRED